MSQHHQITKPSIWLLLGLSATGLSHWNHASSLTVHSRLTATAEDQSSTIQIYTREDILMSGESHVADFIRNLPSNSFGSFRPRSGSTAQGDAAVSLRGIGEGRTLVLVDGRRLPKSPHAPAWQNLNLLPLGAIERIEVMTEGGSALYGADAVGGVINVVTRDDFEGVELMLGTADVSFPKAGGEREEGSLIFGARSDRSSLLAGLSWNDREMVLQRHLPVDLSSHSGGNTFTTLTDGFDDFNFTAYVTGCENLGPGFSLAESSLSLSGLSCVFDLASVSAEEPSLENKSFYAKARHEMNDRWTLWANTSFIQVESFSQLSPAFAASMDSDPLSISSLNNPTNPNSSLYDPSLGLAPQEVNWWHRFAALGNRENTINQQQLDFQVGTQADWSWAALEFGLRHSDNRASDVRRNQLLPAAAEGFIADGSYQLGNPFATPENVLNAMRITLIREAKYDQDEWFTTLRFEAFELPGGPVEMVAGATYMDEEYFDLYDPQSSAGTVAGSGGRSASGDRETTALFLEAGLPINEQLGLNVAARYDDYSDVGSEVSTKFSAMWQPHEQWHLRAVYGQDHRTPDLRTLNQAPFMGAGAITIPVVQPEAVLVANPQLRSEQVDQFSVDLRYEISDHWQMKLGYWDISLDDRIQFFASIPLESLLERGLNTPAGLGCEADGQGGYSRCFVGYGNGGSLEVDGATLDVYANHELFGGQWNSHLQVSHVNEINSEFIGITSSNHPFPSARGRLSNTFTKGDWQVAYHINHITGESDDDDFFYVPSWTSHDVQINYHTPWQGVFTLGAQNIGEELPRFNGQFTLEGDSQYERELYHAYGRIVYARYTQTF